MINILYLSTLCSESLLKHIFDTAIEKPEQAAQKFHRLLAIGFSELPEIKIQTLSTLPINPSNHKKRFWFLKKEYHDKLIYNYIPVINFPFLRNLVVFVFTFFKILFWITPRRHQKLEISDVLNVTVSIAAVLACKIRNIPCIGVVTDLPGMMVTNKKNRGSLFNAIYRRLSKKILVSFDAYILLTRQMNEIVNPNDRPYIIMEGLVDSQMDSVPNELSKKFSEKVLLYAGGLYKKYGVQKMIDAFRLLPDKDIRLFLYGRGPMIAEIKKIASEDTRIIFHGMVPNERVVSDQLKSTLLINPRPTTEEFTKYSFPSKNMEYLVSGTPMVTTKLPGMPDEYLDYLFVFESETVDGMSRTLGRILRIDRNELHKMGEKAKVFALNSKNNVAQAERLLNFLNSQDLVKHNRKAE